MSSLSLVLIAGRGGRPLQRTADAVLRHALCPLELLLTADEGAGSPLVASTALRLGARVVEAGAGRADRINAAVAAASGALIALVPAGFSVDAGGFERLASALDAEPEAEAIAPCVRLHAPDGTAGLVWRPSGPSLDAILADPLAAPRVLVVRRSAWTRLHGYDSELPSLWEFDMWLRLAGAPGGVRILADPAASHEVSPFPPPDSDAGSSHLAVLRMVLRKHQRAVAGAMEDVLVAQEVRFGRLREAHSRMLRHRDAGLAELDRLRAEASHGRAFLAHHGADGLDWGDLRRPDPISRDWGYDRGGPVDRRHIDAFLAAHSSDVRGAVLEIQEDDLTRRFGGPRVESSDVLDIDAENPRATVVADLRSAPEIDSERFDCIILTQTLHVIDDMSSALRECHRMLRPGGVLLATVPAASRVCLEYGADGDFWRLTPGGARALAAPIFGGANLSCDVFGNVLTNVAFLHGLGAQELTSGESLAVDPYFPALTGLRARKRSSALRRGPRGAVLLYHRVDDPDDAHGLAVSPQLFEAHVEWLRTRCSIVPLEDLLGAPPGELPGRAVALTFDDGYLDNLREAAPVLSRHGVPATFFLTSAWLDSPGEYWWDTLARALLESVAVPPHLDLAIDGGTVRLSTAGAAARAAAHRELHPRLVHATLDARVRLVEAIREWAGVDAAGPRRPMMAAEVRELARIPGMTVGAHGVHHLSLPDQPPAVQDEEMEACRAALSRTIGSRVDLFAYPYGAVDESSAGRARERFRWGLTCERAAPGESFDAARVPRVDVKPWATEELAAVVDALFGERASETPAVTLTP